LTALAVLASLIGAMFVAFGSVSAQTATIYSGSIYCTATDPDVPATLQITDSKMRHDDMKYLAYTDDPSEAGPEDVTVVESDSAVACDTINSGTDGEVAVAGDLLVIAMTDEGSDADDPDDDVYGWQREYKELRTDVEDATKTITLLTDNPANPNSGVKDNPDTAADETGDPRPQSWLIPGSTSLGTTDTIESSDKANVIAVIGDAYASGWTVTAGKVGTATITTKIVTAATGLTTTTEYTFEVKDEVKATSDAAADVVPALKVSFPDDSDGVVKDGTDLKVKIETKGTSLLDRVTVSGGLDLYNNVLDDEDMDTVGPMNHGSRVGITSDKDGNVTLWVAVPKGHPAGEYTVAASGKDKLGGRSISGSKIITVGDSGSNVDTASLTLSPLDADGMPTTAAKAQKTQKDSVAADEGKGKVYLSLAALNSLGKPANTGFNVTVSAAGAMIELMESKVGDTVVQPGMSATDNSLTIRDAKVAAFTLIITRQTPGPVAVSAIIVDQAGSGFATSETVNLIFTGPSAELTLGDASGTLLQVAANNVVDGKDTDKRDQITFSLSASDKDGNSTGAPTIGVGSVQVTDPDGKKVADARITYSQGASPVGVPNGQITLTSMGSAALPLAVGEYTIKVSQTAAITAETTFTVVGRTDTIELTASDDAPAEVGDTITVTASLTDADGNAVADGTLVTFTSSDQTADADPVLAHVGNQGAQKTKAGEAKATFVAVGDGTSVITAIADTTNGVVVVNSTAGAVEPEAMPEEEASVACLSNLNGFATWSCGVESSASEIFGLVSGRGATAIHLWNGSAWVRYSVVDGTMVPGSSDFMVAENDILYISN